MSANRLRVLLVSMLAALAVSAIASASASAEVHWWVETNAGGGASEALAAGKKAEFSEFLNVTEATLVSKIKIKGVVVKCNELTFLNKAGTEVEEPNHVNSESFIEGTNGGSIAGLQFSGCKVTTPATGCKIEPVKPGEDTEDITLQEETAVGVWTQTALTLSLKEEGGGGKSFLTFKPKAPAVTFAELKFGNETGCATLKGLTIAVKGETKAEIITPATCAQGHNLKIEENPSKLKVGGVAVEEFDLEVETEGLETVEGHTKVSDICWDAK